MLETLKEILENVKGVPGLAGSLADTADIIDEVGLDSLEMINFMLAVENRLNITIDFESLDFSYLKSLKKLSEFFAKMPKMDL